MKRPAFCASRSSACRQSWCTMARAAGSSRPQMASMPPRRLRKVHLRRSSNGFLRRAGSKSQSRLDDRAGKGAVDRRDKPSLPRVPDDETSHGQLRQGDANRSAPKSEALLEIGFVNIVARKEFAAHEGLSQASARECALAFGDRLRGNGERPQSSSMSYAVRSCET